MYTARLRCYLTQSLRRRRFNHSLLCLTSPQYPSHLRSNRSFKDWTEWQRLPAGDTLRSVSPAGNRCHFVLLDKDGSCPTADLSNIGRPSGPACSTGELLNTPHIFTFETQSRDWSLLVLIGWPWRSTCTGVMKLWGVWCLQQALCK